MSYDLPQWLRNEIEAGVQSSVPQAKLIQAANLISERYRRTEGKATSLPLQNETEALAYLLARMPATYAANARVFAEIRKLSPDFTPETVLDLGAGPGTSSLAAVHSFSSIKAVHLLEQNTYLRQAGQKVVSPYLPSATWGGDNLTHWEPNQTKHDMVLLSYVLNEIPEKSINVILEKTLLSTSNKIIIIEPGTPQGAQVIQHVRNWALGQKGLFIESPCPHQLDCPLKDTSERWCHFAVRVSRSKLHKALKGGDAGFEDEKFAYLVLSKTQPKLPTYRIIGHPSGSKLREIQVCSSNGAETLQVSKSHPLHKLSKKLEWGDGFDL